MQYQLINHSQDLRKLRDKGYKISVTNGGLLVIHHVPYLDKDGNIQSGKLVCALDLATPTLTDKPKDHTMYFIGLAPCHKDRSPMDEIINSSPNAVLVDGFIGNHYLSSKPVDTGKYDNYYDKVKRYVDLISAPARSIDPEQTARIYDPMPDEEQHSTFQYYDTNSSRANIIALNAKFLGLKIGIIGVGGTGAYILDFVSKTQVSEIHLFDGDTFKVHNAFRSPGAASTSELRFLKKKVDFFAEKYSSMHRFIFPHATNIEAGKYDLLAGLSFVFVCVDSNKVRSAIISELTARNIPFTDTGLGAFEMDGQITSIIRTTTATPDMNSHVGTRIVPDDSDDNEYGSNIQIAELNAANAVFAIIRWKKWVGFYQDLRNEHHSTFTINVNEIINKDFGA